MDRRVALVIHRVWGVQRMTIGQRRSVWFLSQLLFPQLLVKRTMVLLFGGRFWRFRVGVVRSIGTSVVRRRRV